MVIIVSTWETNVLYAPFLKPMLEKTACSMANEYLLALQDKLD